MILQTINILMTIVDRWGFCPLNLAAHEVGCVGHLVMSLLARVVVPDNHFNLDDLLSGFLICGKSLRQEDGGDNNVLPSLGMICLFRLFFCLLSFSSLSLFLLVLKENGGGNSRPAGL